MWTRFCLTLVTTAAAWLMPVDGCYAQADSGQKAVQETDDPQTPAGAVAAEELRFPLREPAIEIPYVVNGQRRVLALHIEDPKAGRRNVFYLRPPFFPIESEKPYGNNYSPVIHFRGPEPRGPKMRLDMVLLVHNAELVEYCKDYIVANPQTVILPPTKETEYDLTDRNNLQILEWPIVRPIIQLWEDDDTWLATFNPSGVYTTIKGSLDVRFKLDAIALDRLNTATSSASGTRRGPFIRPFYTYSGRGTSTTTDTIKAGNQLREAIKFELSSRQLEGSVDITQLDRVQIEQKVATEIRRTITSDHPNCVNFPQPAALELLGRIFDPAEQLSIETLEGAFPEFQQQLAAYLMPHLKTIETVDGVDEIQVVVNQDTRSTLDQFQGGLAFEGFSFGRDTQDERAHLSRLEDATRVKFEKRQGESFWRPHQIASYKLREGWGEQDFTSSTVAFQAIANDKKSYRQESDVPLSLTAKKFFAQIEVLEQTLPSRDWQVGDVMVTASPVERDPYYWAPAVGEPYVFPDEAGTPASLRLKPVPDLRGALIGGASTPEEVGQLWNDGVVELASRSLSGNISRGENATRTMGFITRPTAPQILRDNGFSFGNYRIDGIRFAIFHRGAKVPAKEGGHWANVSTFLYRQKTIDKQSVGTTLLPELRKFMQPRSKGSMTLISEPNFHSGVGEVTVLTADATLGLENCQVDALKIDRPNFRGYPPHVRFKTYVLIRPLPRSLVDIDAE